jgi:RimJ/RimL family protein N-acetyltransferase
MKTISIVDVYDPLDALGATVFLYDLLADRDPAANISHRDMPTFDDHRKFVESRPYKAWYLVWTDAEPVGATYLTHANEIGIFILKAHRGNGYGKQAAHILMQMHPAKRFLANIAPGNPRSLAMFGALGFEFLQHTLSRRMEMDFKQYRRTQIAEMTPWEPGTDMASVSISKPDKEAGSPKAGDMIARNPKNHDDKWLVAAKYFADNFEPI